MAASASAPPSGAHATSAAQGDRAPLAAYAYWLTSPEVGSYVHLLVTGAPLELRGPHAVPLPLPGFEGARAVLVATYQKDSIWNTDMRPFKPVFGYDAVDPSTRTARIDSMTYTYARAPLAEVAALLQRPEGLIPISRRHAALAGGEPTARALLDWIEAARTSDGP